MKTRTLGFRVDRLDPTDDYEDWPIACEGCGAEDATHRVVVYLDDRISDPVWDLGPDCMVDRGLEGELDG